MEAKLGILRFGILDPLMEEGALWRKTDLPVADKIKLWLQLSVENLQLMCAVTTGAASG